MRGRIGNEDRNELDFKHDKKRQIQQINKSEIVAKWTIRFEQIYNGIIWDQSRTS